MKVLPDEIVKALASELMILGYNKYVAMSVVHMMRNVEQAQRMLEYLKREQPKDAQLIYGKMEEICGLVDFSKKSETLKYFNRLLPALKNNKIKSVFTLYSPMWNHHDGYRTYDADTEVYILFEDDMCLVIHYLAIDGLNIEYRPLLKKEQEIFERIEMKDFFNSIDEIYDSTQTEVTERQTISLEYDSIESVCINSMTGKYGKWINRGIEYVRATVETFGQIEFRMKNGKAFVICPCGAITAGGVMLWSEDALEVIEER